MAKCTYLSIIKVNDLNTPIKRNGTSKWIKNKTYLYGAT